MTLTRRQLKKRVRHGYSNLISANHSADNTEGIVSRHHHHHPHHTTLKQKDTFRPESDNSIVSPEMYSNIVRIISHTTEFDFEMPFKINGTATFTGTGFFIKYFSGGDKSSITSELKMKASFCAGLVSAIPCSLWELTMIQQQRFGGMYL